MTRARWERVVGSGPCGCQTGRIAPWRFRSRRRRGGGAGSSGRRAGRATASAAGAIALQSAAFWHAGPIGRSWGCHWLGVQRAELASAAVRGRALKIGIANFPRTPSSAGGASGGKAASRRPVRLIHADKPFVRLVQRRSARTGRGLGLPLGVAYRHPFPGLGLGVRTSGEKARDA